MAITAAMVKELRLRTGSGMMDCKRALTETNGDLEAAVELMRKSGAAKADKKASRVAADGRIMVAASDDQKTLVMVEINAETDFVAKDGNFLDFANGVANTLLANKPTDIATLLTLPLVGSNNSVEEARTALITKIGENIQVRRFQMITTNTGVIGQYQHGTRISVAVVLEGGDEALGKEIAMHIAASNPLCISEKDVPADTLAKEKGILIAQAEGSGKPAKIVEKIVTGRLRKYLAGITLVGQPFIKDTDKTVGQLLKEAGAEIVSFTRLELGEGIEKKQEDFAAEVMAQVKG